MPQSNDGRKTFTAGADILRGERLKFDGVTAGSLIKCGADEKGFTTAISGALSGEPISTRMDNWTVEGIAGAAIAEGADLEQAANGKIVTIASGKRVGLAIEAAAADGELIEYLPAETR